jgi:hypothetical protein
VSAYSEHNSRHRRLSILRILAESPAYCANDSLLGTLVNDFGIVSTRDQVRTEMSWLRDQGFLTLKDTSGVMVAVMTEAGGEIASGRRTDPGIARPSPRG